jgi:poly(3-hydroxybutyrate) depolymerase
VPDSAQPLPLLVVLHGDLGDVARMTRTWSKAAEQAQVVLASLACPKDRGCNASWWRWYLGARHDDAWLGAQIDAIAGGVPVDRRRIYAAGYSGGASYLGYYVPTHPERFAAVCYAAGGVRFVSECSACKTPVEFLIGSSDPMLKLYVETLHRWYEGCGGHAIEWQVLPGVSHEGLVDVLAAGKAAQVVSWMLAQQPSCVPSSSPR